MSTSLLEENQKLNEEKFKFSVEENGAKRQREIKSWYVIIGKYDTYVSYSVGSVFMYEEQSVNARIRRIRACVIAMNLHENGTRVNSQPEFLVQYLNTFLRVDLIWMIRHGLGREVIW